MVLTSIRLEENLLRFSCFFYLVPMEKWIRPAFLMLSILLMVSVIYSKFMLSVSMIGMVILAMLSGRRSLKIRTKPAFMLVTLFFLLMLLSGLNSSNVAEWMHHVRMKLPFLALPFALAALPRVSSRDYLLLHYIFLAIISLSTVPVMAEILFNYSEVYQGLAHGQPVPTPVHHVKYSIFTAFAIVVGMVLWKRNFTLLYRSERTIVGIVVVYLVIFIHFMAVRSGILTLYAAVLVLALVYAIQRRAWIVGAAMVLVLTILPVLAYNLVPSLQKRIDYMVYDLQKYKENGGEAYSDSERIHSLQVGWDIFSDHPVFGTGIGDFKDACREEYRQRFGPDKYVLYPHNQYLFILGGTGIFGLLVFLIAFVGPMWTQQNYRESLLLTLFVIYATVFMVDNVFERSFSAAFYAYFLCLGLNHRMPE